MKFLLFASVLACASTGILSQWKQPLSEIYEGKSGFPIDAGYHGGIASQYLPLDTAEKDQCELYKVGFKQDLYFQYVQYKTAMPDLKEFTLCMWNKFTNHSNDHPLFSYAGMVWFLRNFVGLWGFQRVFYGYRKKQGLRMREEGGEGFFYFGFSWNLFLFNQFRLQYGP